MNTDARDQDVARKHAGGGDTRAHGDPHPHPHHAPCLFHHDNDGGGNVSGNPGGVPLAVAGRKSSHGTSSAGARLSPLQRARAFVAALREEDAYDASILAGLTVESAGRGRVVCRMQATQHHANRYG